MAASDVLSLPYNPIQPDDHAHFVQSERPAFHPRGDEVEYVFGRAWRRRGPPPTAVDGAQRLGRRLGRGHRTSRAGARRTAEADEAALLLLDTSGTMLVPVAALGLDRPAHAGFRVPVGAGFAGRVAATRRPVILADVEPGSVLNPAFHRAGIKSLLGVPVSGPTGLLGVVHVGSATPRVFTEHDTAQLEKLADQLAVQVLRRRASEEHIAALALQRSLLPTAPQRRGPRRRGALRPSGRRPRWRLVRRVPATRRAHRHRDG